MKLSVVLLASLAVCALIPNVSFGQITFTLGFNNTANCGGVIEGAPGSKVQFDVLATLTQADFATGKGASGFSIGFRAENATLLPNTAASGASCGTGELVVPIADFFCSATSIDPAKSPESGPLAGNPQGEGYVDGLAFTIGKSLQGNATFTVGKVRAEVTIPATGETTARFVFIDGLQGPGQPVKNGITSGGKTVDVASGQLTLGSCEITLRGAVAQQHPGDTDQNGVLELNDVQVLLAHLFHGDPPSLPCESHSIYSPGNKALLDANGDAEVDISDCIYELSFLFLGGPAHVLGRACISIAGCPDVPACQDQ